jgi:predicted Zn-dependent protease
MIRQLSQLRFLAGLAATLLAACTTVPVTGRSQLNLLDADTETQLGVRSFAEVKQQSPISHDPAANAVVQRVGRRIAAASGLNVNWEFVVIAEKQVNAFALPGGKVAVYQGLLPVARDDAGLATVLAHEVGHVLAHHSAERVSRSELVQAGTSILAAVLGGSDPASQEGMAALLGAGATYGIELPFSREQEYEADRIGLTLMARAGYDPHAALAFWERMMASQSAGGPPELLSDHPSDANRLQRLQELMPEAMQSYRPS